jgi:hypothetical protein
MCTVIPPRSTAAPAPVTSSEPRDSGVQGFVSWRVGDGQQVTYTIRVSTFITYLHIAPPSSSTGGIFICDFVGHWG